ncbi:MAG: GYF domain-containing protein [Verrucomicrobiota bacterium]
MIGCARYRISFMSEWYYARGGQQCGPVTFEQLASLARSGGLDATKDLVWTSTMKDWTAAGQVPGLFSSVSHDAAPSGAWTETPPPVVSSLIEISPGSEPIDVIACVKRGFELTKRQFGTILLVGLVYFAVFMGLSMVIGIFQGIVGALTPRNTESISGVIAPLIMVASQVALQVFSMFLGLGMTRIGLNLVSGKTVSVGILFGEGRKLLRVFGAVIVFGLMVLGGLLLLIVPGIYIALKYSQYMIAIVDRDMGIMESLSYSSSITTNNRWKLFLLGLLATVIAIAGMLACGVGLFFAMPVIWLSYIAAYRWMQYGHRAMMDHPGTNTPLLADVP